MNGLFPDLSPEECRAIEEELSTAMLAKALGEHVLRCLEDLQPALLAQLLSSRQSQLLAQIKAILDHPDAQDSDCFYAIEAIVDAFERQGLTTTRHDFG